MLDLAKRAALNRVKQTAHPRLQCLRLRHSLCRPNAAFSGVFCGFALSGKAFEFIAGFSSLTLYCPILLWLLILRASKAQWP